MTPVTPSLRGILLLATAALASAGAVADDLLERWLRAWQGGLAIEARSAAAYRSHLERAALAARDDPAERERLRLALVDTIALAPAEAQPSTDFSTAIAVGSTEDEGLRMTPSAAANAAAAGSAIVIWVLARRPRAAREAGRGAAPGWEASAGSSASEWPSLQRPLRAAARPACEGPSPRELHHRTPWRGAELAWARDDVR